MIFDTMQNDDKRIVTAICSDYWADRIDPKEAEQRIDAMLSMYAPKGTLGDDVTDEVLEIIDNSQVLARKVSA